jgi:hypothetical protein
MDRARGYYVKWNKPGTEIKTLNDLILIGNLKKEEYIETDNRTVVIGTATE